MVADPEFKPKSGDKRSAAYAVCTVSLKKANKMGESLDSLAASDILILAMDFNTAHDIIHEDSGNKSEYCPVCGGTLKGDAVEERAGQIIKEQRSRRYSSSPMWGGEWSTAFVNDLPDSSFAYIEPGGEKDSDGKTTPRSLRHLPYKDADGNVDLPHVRVAITRLSQVKSMSKEEKNKALKMFQALVDKNQRADRQQGNHPKRKQASDNMSDSSLKMHNVPLYPLSPILASEDGQLPDKIQIMPIGEWDTVPYGKITISADDLTQMVENFHQGVRAGVPIDVDHDGKAAAGWINDLEVGEDGLYAAVEWTDLGQKLLGEKQYKFFSPEFNPEYTDPENKHLLLNNVLIAGSLVNRPLFKELKPLVASEGLTDKKNGVMLFIESMNYDELKKKKAAGEKLTADEEAFMKKKDDADAADAKKASEEAEKAKQALEAGEKKGVTISAAEYKALQEKADQGVLAAEKLEAKEISDTVDSWMFSENGGHFQPAIKNDLVSFYKSLSEAQRKTFSELVAKMPEQKLLFKEAGSAEDLTPGGAADMLTVRAKELMEEARKANKNLKFSDAVKQALREKPELGDYKMTPVQGKVRGQ